MFDGRLLHLRALSRVKVMRVCQLSVLKSASSVAGSSNNNGEVNVLTRTFMSSFEDVRRIAV